LIAVIFQSKSAARSIVVLEDCCAKRQNFARTKILPALLKPYSREARQCRTKEDFSVLKAA